MKATEILTAEHQVVERVVRVLESAAEGLEKEESAPTEIFMRIVEVARELAQRCHEEKEESLLPPFLEKHEVTSDNDLLRIVLSEHELARSCLEGIEDAARRLESGEEGARQALGLHVRNYVCVVRQHLRREELIFFPELDKVLQEEDQAELTRLLEKIEQEKEAGNWARQEALLIALEGELGITGQGKSEPE